MFRKKPLTIEDFQTWESTADIMLQILEPLKPFYSEGKARVHIGETSAHYENDSVPMEAFARPLWGLIPFWAGGGSEPEFEEFYRKGLAARILRIRNTGIPAGIMIRNSVKWQRLRLGFCFVRKNCGIR